MVTLPGRPQVPESEDTPLGVNPIVTNEELKREIPD